MMQTATTGDGHTHITPNGQTNLTFLINSSNPTAPFQLPPGTGGHSHSLQLTDGEVHTLRSGGSVIGKVVGAVGAPHVHIYTISCA
jgi:hypothetical protein